MSYGKVSWEGVWSLIPIKCEIGTDLQEFCLSNRKSTCGKMFTSVEEELICSISWCDNSGHLPPIWTGEITQAGKLSNSVLSLALWRWHSQLTVNILPWEQIEDKPWISGWQTFHFTDYKSCTKLSQELFCTFPGNIYSFPWSWDFSFVVTLLEVEWKGSLCIHNQFSDKLNWILIYISLLAIV